MERFTDVDGLFRIFLFQQEARSLEAFCRFLAGQSDTSQVGVDGSFFSGSWGCVPFWFGQKTKRRTTFPQINQRHVFNSMSVRWILTPGVTCTFQISGVNSPEGPGLLVEGRNFHRKTGEPRSWAGNFEPLPSQDSSHSIPCHVLARLQSLALPADLDTPSSTAPSNQLGPLSWLDLGTNLLRLIVLSLKEWFTLLAGGAFPPATKTLFDPFARKHPF